MDAKRYYWYVLQIFLGTDTDAVRQKLNAAVGKAAKGSAVVRITDAHSRADLDAALQGGGMFAQRRVVVFDNVLTNPELSEVLIAALPRLPQGESFFVVERALDTTTKKILEKSADMVERFDTAKIKKQETIFELANALQHGEKKALWVGYQRELSAGKAPEAIHGVLFWAAKQALLRQTSEKNRALVAALAELPHEARRRGFDLEYALEHFVLSRT